jgi:hypothetical protein
MTGHKPGLPLLNAIGPTRSHHRPDGGHLPTTDRFLITLIDSTISTGAST